jgi:hypothetical protein
MKTMKKIITSTYLFVLGLMGCVLDPTGDGTTAFGDGNDGNDFAESEESDEETAGSETGDSTSDTESDTTEDMGDGDGDSDSTDGGTAEPVSLEVHSDGVRIGYLQSVQAYSLGIYDDQNEFIFVVNEVTGYVAPGAQVFYESNDCSGEAYVQSVVPLEACDQAPLPLRRSLYAWPPTLDFVSGWDEATELRTTSGSPFTISPGSYQQGNGCLTYPDLPMCVLTLTQQAAIPTTFDLPITIVESGPDDGP